MLLSFSITNYRSFRSEQTLNLLASKRLGDTEQSPHCFPIPGMEEHALRVASLYGANGAGKSNLVRALALLRRLVLHGTSPGERVPCEPFLLDNNSPAEPTTFELQFLQDGQVFRFGVCYDSERVHEEWLDVYEGKKELSLYARRNSEDGTVTVELGTAGKAATHPKRIEALANVGARPNQLFLNEVVNLDNAEAQGPRFRDAIRWFSSSLRTIKPGAVYMPVANTIATDQTFADFAGKFLREASTGISGLEVHTEPIEKSGFMSIPTEFLDRAIDRLSTGESLVFPGPDGEEMLVERTAKGTITVRTIATHRIVAQHGLGTALHRLPLKEESDGSQRLLNLLPALYRLTKDGGVCVIDELERSMHPMLARKFVEFFLKAVPNAKGQLIFTTHESTLLDQDLMRRDEIWFAEKDPEGATHLYSLSDFKVRNDLRIDKGYLEGRFGAIPFLGGIDQLMEQQASAETSE
ncbi:MAG: ATP/GTP-binding protein [Pirellulales bacterium]|nr:ATP/GTP-binding protein [Pirellulales bacterium]